MSNIFFTSDTHFGHFNIIKYCGRPFQTVYDMDETIIANWNSVVNDNDDVWHLGDFCKGHFNNYFPRLNGHIHFIEGNHDKPAFEHRRDFASYSKFREIKIDGQDITLCHYALQVWNKSHHGAWHLYGHSHGTLPDDPHKRAFDAGVDSHNFRPLEFSEVKAIISKKLWKPIDHHGVRLAGGGVGLNKEDYQKLVRQQSYEQLKKEFECLKN